MIVMAFDPPPMLYPVQHEEQYIALDPRDPASAYPFAPGGKEGALIRHGTSNVPSQNIRYVHSVDLRWQGQTSAHIDVPAASDGQDLGVPAQLASIKRLTGYGWEQVASLLGCTRQTLHLWNLGEAISGAKRDRLAKLHAAIRFLDRGNAEDNRALLDMACDGSTIAQLLSESRFEEAKVVAGRGTGRQDARWGKVERAELAREDHWYSRLVGSPNIENGDVVVTKPQLRKRLKLKKG